MKSSERFEEQKKSLMDEFMKFNESVPTAVQKMHYEIRRESIIQEEVIRRRTAYSKRGPPPEVNSENLGMIPQNIEEAHEDHDAFLQSLFPAAP